MTGAPVTLLTAAALLFMTACASHSHSPRFDSLASEIQALCADLQGEEVAVAFRDLESGGTVLLNGHLVMHAASTMKTAVMFEAYRQHDAGAGAMDAAIPVTNRFSSIADGSGFSLSPDRDSESDLYQRIGTGLPMRELIRRMMVRSSNLATNIVIQRVNAERVQGTLRDLGCDDMKVLRGVEDIPAFEAGMNNVTTAYDLMLLLSAIHEGQGVSPESREEMIRVLLAQEFNDMIPAGVPEGTAVAHKTGLITRIRHDSAIVYPADRSPYILVVLTRGFDHEDAAGTMVRRISEVVWKHASKETP